MFVHIALLLMLPPIFGKDSISYTSMSFTCEDDFVTSVSDALDIDQGLYLLQTRATSLTASGSSARPAQAVHSTQKHAEVFDRTTSYHSLGEKLLMSYLPMATQETINMSSILPLDPTEDNGTGKLPADLTALALESSSLLSLPPMNLSKAQSASPTFSALDLLIKAFPIKSGVNQTTEIHSHVKELKSNKMLINIVALTVLLILTVIGPDHLATLVQLSSSTKGFAAFKIGLIWGLGHTIGIMLIVPVLMLLEGLNGGKSAGAKWELIGNYFIGAMMICLGIYFYLYEGNYIIRQEDGTYVAQGCECCDNPFSDLVEETRAGASSSGNEYRRKSRANPVPTPRFKIFGNADTGYWSMTRAYERGNAELALSPDGGGVWGSRGIESTIIGLLQGLACPTGLQTVIILAHISQSFSVLIMLFFAAGFYIGSVVFSGVATLLIAEMLQRGLGTWVSPKVLYTGCCAFTFILGIAWLILNAYGLLASLG